MDCVFCSIVVGALPADVVLDEPDFIGVLDRRPVFKGHVLLVPREHVDTLLELPPRLHAGLTGTTQRLARAAVEALGAQGTFVATNLLAKHDERYMPRELEGMTYNETTHLVSVEM